MNTPQRFTPKAWSLRTRTVTNAERTVIMGILNVTPDSFSDGGQFVSAEEAVEHGLSMIAHGADVIDVGGESTRPGSRAVETSVELDRVVPVVERLTAENVVVSVDTTKVAVAEACLDAGAEIINDVSGLAAEDMRTLVSDAGAGAVVMHMQGTPETMQQNPVYGDVVAEVAVFLEEQVALAVHSGIEPEKLCVDPGIGFGKTIDNNLALLAAIRRFTTSHPVLVGVSRKGFLGTILGAPEPADRDVATAGFSAYLASEGVFGVRVHDVAASRDALAPVDAMVRAVP